MLRTAGTGSDGRRASWTELFFDLVFVVAVERGTAILEHDLSWEGARPFAVVLLVVVWSWINFVLYTERFDTDDIVHRAMKAAAMPAIAGVAVTAPSATTGNVRGVAVAFLAARAPCCSPSTCVRGGTFRRLGADGRLPRRIHGRPCARGRRSPSPQPLSAPLFAAAGVVVGRQAFVARARDRGRRARGGRVARPFAGTARVRRCSMRSSCCC